MYPDMLFSRKHLGGIVLSCDAQQPNCRQNIDLCVDWAKDPDGLKHVHRRQLDFSLKGVMCT